MLRAVLDANVFVSAAIHPDGPPGRIIEQFLRTDAFTLVLSEAIVDEIMRALVYPKVRRYMRPGLDPGLWMEDLVVLADFVPDPSQVSGVSKDPDDDKYLGRSHRWPRPARREWRSSPLDGRGVRRCPHRDAPSVPEPVERLSAFVAGRCVGRGGCPDLGDRCLVFVGVPLELRDRLSLLAANRDSDAASGRPSESLVHIGRRHHNRKGITDPTTGLLSRGSRVRVAAGAPILRGSIPETWVTPYSGDMGNSFGPKGLSIGSSRHVSSSKYPKS